ncbi:MAG: hypothetical protein V1779_07940 [bacterium]
MEKTDKIPCPRCKGKSVSIGSPNTFKVLKWFLIILVGGSVSSVLSYLTEVRAVGIISFFVIAFIVKTFPNMVMLKCNSCGKSWFQPYI